MATRTKHNLHRDGVEVCAEKIIAAMTNMRGLHAVYIDAIGDVRTIPERSVKQKHRPDSEKLGSYRADVSEKNLCADLSWWRDAMMAENAEEAA